MQENQPDYQEFAIWVYMVFVALQVLGCISSIVSMIYIYRTFEVSKPLYLVVFLDSIVTFLGFLAIYVATMAIGIINESDPQHFKGNYELFMIF